MAKRNMGKVKHYRRSFYTGGQRAKRIAGAAALLVGLFLAGWLAGPAVIDFGTSTWYKIKWSLSGKEEEQLPAPTPAPENTPAVQETEEPSPEPTPQPEQNPGEGGWAFLSVTSVQGPEQAQATAEQLAAQGVRYAVLPFKDDQGYVYYDSQVETARACLSSTTFDPAAAAAALKEKGIVPVASISVFQDPAAANADRSMAVRYQDQDYLWLDRARDKGGKPWLNPASERAVAYNEALIREAKEMGCEEVWLTHLQFPPATGRAKANFGDTAGRSMDRILADALARFQAIAPCWVEYPLEEAARGAESQLLGAAPGALGTERVVLRSEEAADPQMLDTVAEIARADGASVIAVLEAGAFRLL